MGNQVFEVIKIDKKKIKLKKENTEIEVNSNTKFDLKVGDFVECVEIWGAVTIEKKVDPSSLKKINNKTNNNSSRKTNTTGSNKITEIKGDTPQFVYPFNFVSLGDENEIEESRSPIKKGDYTGKIKCKLTNLTPISVGSEKSNEFIKFKNKFVIPASSLKGEIRNIIEVLTTSCIKNVKEKHLYKRIPENFKACKETNHLCFACRLFGSTGNDMEEMTVSQKSYKGRVFFSDAVINKNVNTLTLSLILGAPKIEENKPALRRFYITPNGKIRGRKFFWHQKELFIKKDLSKAFHQNSEKVMATISCIDINQEFNFEIHFENLTDEELGVLVYALELEKGLLHKFGRAKAYGFGSCEIKVKEILLDNKNKYQSFAVSSDKNLDFLEKIKEKYINSTKKQVKELKAILSQDNKVCLGYPKPFPDRNTLNKFKGKNLPNILEYK